MKNKITKFPIRRIDKRKNTLGPLVVECQVTGRYLKFDKHSMYVGDAEFLTADLFPAKENIDDPDGRRICELIITKEDLLNALAHITVKNDIDL